MIDAALITLFARHRLRDWDLEGNRGSGSQSETEGWKAFLACHMVEARICESLQAHPERQSFINKGFPEASTISSFPTSADISVWCYPAPIMNVSQPV